MIGGVRYDSTNTVQLKLHCLNEELKIKFVLTRISHVARANRSNTTHYFTHITVLRNPSLLGFDDKKEVLPFSLILTAKTLMKKSV